MGFLKLIVLSLWLSSFLLGAVLENIGAPTKVLSLSGVDVPIYKEAKFRWKGNPQDGTILHLTGAGIRKKKIVLISVNVYLAASYVDRKEPLNAEKPLDSLEKCKVRALRLTFLRDVGMEKIRSSFSDALIANGINVDSPTMQKVLSQLTFDVKKGQALTLLGLSTDTPLEKVVFETPDKMLQAEGVKAAQDFWKIWFGVPADGGMENLKPELISTAQLLSQ